MNKKNTYTYIGAFDAKTHLSQLLRDVQEGRSYVVTLRGKPVARLVPFEDESESLATETLLEQFEAIRMSVGGEVDISAYIKEGRKY